MMHFLKSLTVVAALMMNGTAVVFAQNQDVPEAPEIFPVAPEEISDEELLAFSDVSDALRPIQTKARDDLQQAIEDTGISMERFQQIAMAMQNPQMTDHLELTAAEESALEELQPKLHSIDQEAREDMVDQIVMNGLSIMRYQQIYLSIQEHEELLDRLDRLKEE